MHFHDYEMVIHNCSIKNYFILGASICTVEPPIKDSPNKEHLSIKDKSTRPISYYTSTF